MALNYLRMPAGGERLNPRGYGSSFRGFTGTRFVLNAHPLACQMKHFFVLIPGPGAITLITTFSPQKCTMKAMFLTRPTIVIWL